MDSLGSAKNILITGLPRSGKTTVVMSVAQSLGELAGGFYTQEVKEGGRRTGFLIVSLEGREGFLAHMNLKHGPRVGKYTVDLESLESVGVSSIRSALENKQVVVVDEIGKMELYSEHFKKEVLRALDSPLRVLATIREGSEPFCDAVRGRRDVKLITVTEVNRGLLPDLLIRALGP